MDESYFRKITTTVILALLFVLTYFLIQPILLSLIASLLLAFIFSPVYNGLHRLFKSKTLSAAIVCALLLALIIIPLWFLMPFLIDQSVKLYLVSQQLDLVEPLKKIFPALFSSQEFSNSLASVIHSFVTKATNFLMSYFSQLLLDFPKIVLHAFVIFFSFFFALRDKDEIISYVKSLLPFSKEVEKRLFDSTKEITSSIINGQVVLGLIQGVILGIGLFLFGVPNAFALSLLGVVAGILPIVGPSIVGVPTIIYLVVAGNYFSALGMTIFTLMSSLSDTILRPILIAKRARLHKVILLVGMIGGILLFGILGLILGPLILAYLIIIIEIYRNKTLPAILIQEPEKK